MSKRAIAWIAVGVLGTLAAAGALWSVFGASSIVLSETLLQERVNRQLPREVKGVTIEKTTVTVADGRVALRVEVRASAAGQAFAAVIFARGVPRYDSERGELFFDAEDVKMENLTIGSGGNPASRLGGRIGDAVKDNLPRVEAAAGNLVAAGIKAYLAARPVYRFKDDFKGVVLKAAITDVAIEGHSVAIGVALISLGAMLAVFLGALLVILVIVVQLVRHPGWGRSTPAVVPTAT